MLNKSGFTLTEILTAVIIIAILTVMAVPLYEKTIERSHLAEAQTLLNRLQTAKNQAMDNMECSSYDVSQTNCPQLKHLNLSFKSECAGSSTSFCSKYFRYSINPSTLAGGVCAVRLGGEYDGTTFLYHAEETGESTAHSGTHTVFNCYGTHCEDYGYPVTSGSVTCN